LSVNDEDIEVALHESDDLINENFPQFSVDIRRYRPELNYRLKIWLKQTIRVLLHETKSGLPFDDAISIVLPWRVEDSLFSRKLGLFGRADRIYNDGYSLKPEDIKTHNTRFSTLLQGESYRIQLLSYSIMCEEKYNMPSNENRIFFSSDLTYLEYLVTPDSRKELENMVAKAKAIVSNGTLPPILQGVESIKCNYCFMRQLCYQLDQNQKVQDDWLNRLISKSESDCTNDSLFGRM
jgi:CRISPR/Cas system-associated exonuclease Cas4 (RecB family)